MPRLSLATWNINSVRLRIDRVAAFIDREAPDILCLQEIKCQPAEFPLKAFEAVGLPHVHISGQKGMHGVAIASRLPFDAIETPPFCQHGHARCAAVRVAGVEIHNLYVPAGADIPDPAVNDKFAHKLDFIERMRAAYGARAGAALAPLFVVGDINIAPQEHDVWSHRQLLDVVSHTPVETQGLNRILEEGGFLDVARVKHPPEEKLYTWWSYRAADWRLSNRGRRLDHIWADQAAAQLADFASFRIHTSERGGEKPSDHVPVTVTFNASE
ncbi:MAG: exodeoxyribonuclease III [Alphaproteobacteria bacterium]|nr:exodeoxyribonuclease III [Alphaproteobacteria bacterium]